MNEPIMTVHVVIDQNEVSRLYAKNGRVTIIPFKAYVKSDLFTGETLPGAADVQTTDASGIKHMCAKYMFEGIDSKGNKCRLFVENNGYFEPNSHTIPFNAYPIFMSDNEELNDYLGASFFRAEGYGTDEGVDIKIFDVRITE